MKNIGSVITIGAEETDEYFLFNRDSVIVDNDKVEDMQWTKLTLITNVFLWSGISKSVVSRASFIDMQNTPVRGFILWKDEWFISESSWHNCRKNSKIEDENTLHSHCYNSTFLPQPTWSTTLIIQLRLHSQNHKDKVASSLHYYLKPTDNVNIRPRPWRTGLKLRLLWGDIFKLAGRMESHGDFPCEHLSYLANLQ